MERERIRTTLSSMGPRTEASLTKHFVQKNCWESNLVADIRENKPPTIDHCSWTTFTYWAFWTKRKQSTSRGEKYFARPQQSKQRPQFLREQGRNTTITNTVLANAIDSKIVEKSRKHRARTIQRELAKAVPRKRCLIVCAYFVAFR